MLDSSGNNKEKLMQAFCYLVLSEKLNFRCWVHLCKTGTFKEM